MKEEFASLRLDDTRHNWEACKVPHGRKVMV